MADRTTKVLLGLLVLGVWLNLWDRPTESTLRTIETRLLTLEADTKEIHDSISEIHDFAETTESHIDELASGSCGNSFLCR